MQVSLVSPDLVNPYANPYSIEQGDARLNNGDMNVLVNVKILTQCQMYTHARDSHTLCTYGRTGVGEVTVGHLSSLCIMAVHVKNNCNFDLKDLWKFNIYFQKS